MRVITGVARGKILVTVPGSDLVRPTSQKVKESLFSSIQFDIEGRSVLDLFAGSGQLGIEALSRGAKSAVFVDNSDISLKTVKKNLENTPFADKAKLIKNNYAVYLLTCSEMFDIAFLDPPYKSDYLLKALQGVEKHINLNGTVFCEHPVEVMLPESIGGLIKHKDYRFGKIFVTAYKKRNL